MSLLKEAPRPDRPGRIDIIGAASAAGGLSALIFGLSSAQRNGWTDPRSAAALLAAAALIAVFVIVESRTRQPLLPLHIPADRTRGGSYLAIAFNSLGLFGAFLFLTYYLQQVRDLTPLETGLAFLPLALTIIITAQTITGRLLPRTGPRVLLTAGPLLGALGMAWLAQLGPNSDYAVHILPALLLIGLAAGSTVAPAMSTATSTVVPEEAGIASALVNTSQQLGGAVGLAVLSTVAATANEVNSYTTVFYVAAGIYVGAAVICACLIRPDQPVQTHDRSRQD